MNESIIIGWGFLGVLETMTRQVTQVEPCVCTCRGWAGLRPTILMAVFSVQWLKLPWYSPVLHLRWDWKPRGSCVKFCPAVRASHRN